MKTPLISIIMPTLDAENTIQYSLKSINRQNYPKDRIEILVVDGGSKDRTTKIVKRYGAKVISNPNIQPEAGKSLGLQKAKGKYAMFLDSDEALISPTSISDKVKLIEKNPGCKNIATAGLLKPEGYPFISDYINRYGEPFSYFLYRLDGGEYFSSLIKRYHHQKIDKSYVVISFREDDITPIVDGGGHFFDLDYLWSIADISDPQLPAKVFSLMSSKTHQLGILKDDFVLHYSRPSLRGYLKKIHWRILSNLTATNSTPGFKNREKLNRKLVYKKYLFIPYAFSLVLPLADSLLLSIKHLDIGYLLHFPLAVFTAADVIIQAARINIFKITTQVGAYK